MDGILSPSPNLYAEALTHNVVNANNTVFGLRAFKEVIKIK